MRLTEEEEEDRDWIRGEERKKTRRGTRCERNKDGGRMNSYEKMDIEKIVYC